MDVYIPLAAVFRRLLSSAMRAASSVSSSSAESDCDSDAVGMADPGNGVAVLGPAPAPAPDVPEAWAERWPTCWGCSPYACVDG